MTEQTVQCQPVDLSPLCDGLIDQDVSCGSDPIGHACFNKAEWYFTIDGQAFRVCEKCRLALTLGPWEWDYSHAKHSVSLMHRATGLTTAHAENKSRQTANA